MSGSEVRLLVTVDCLRLDAAYALYSELAGRLGRRRLEFKPLYAQGAPTPPAVYNYIAFARFGGAYHGRLGARYTLHGLPSATKLLRKLGYHTLMVAGCNPYLVPSLGWNEHFARTIEAAAASPPLAARRRGGGLRVADRIDEFIKTSRGAVCDALTLLKALMQLARGRLPAAKPPRESILVAWRLLEEATRRVGGRITAWLHIDDLHAPLYNPFTRSRIANLLLSNITASIYDKCGCNPLLIPKLVRSLYEANLKLVAATIAHLVERLEEEANQVELVILGDHGEALGEVGSVKPTRCPVLYGHSQPAPHVLFTGLIHSSSLSVELAPAAGGVHGSAAAVKAVLLSGVLGDSGLRRLLEPYSLESGALISEFGARVTLRVEAMAPPHLLVDGGYLVDSSSGSAVRVRISSDYTISLEEAGAPTLSVDPWEVMVVEHRRLIRVGVVAGIRGS